MKRILSLFLVLLLVLTMTGCPLLETNPSSPSGPSISAPTGTSPAPPTVESTDAPTISTTEPSDSTEDTQPNGATIPTEPSSSTTPTQPSGSTTPTQPSGSTTPTQPSGSTTPTQPSGSTTPTQPSGSTTPTQPSGSTTPTQPSGSTTPTQPSGSTTPTQPSGSTTSTTPTQPTTPPVINPDPGTYSSLEVYYIDVGQADCILLECAGEYMLIDGGNVADSSLVVSYLDKLGVQELEIVVNTHPHEDHVGGLAGVLAVYPTKAVYASSKTYDSKAFNNFLKYADQQRLTIQIPSPGDTMTLGDASITVLGPVKSYANVNDTSIVLMVTLGQTRFLFAGDMETTAENDMLEYWDGRFDFRADVLKVGHHGSENASGYRFLYYAQPQYGVISVGKTNSYGHPHEAALSRLRDADISVYKTSEMGTIVATSDGASISFVWEKGNAQPSIPNSGSSTTTQPTEPPATESAGIQYIGTKSTKKFHLPTCQYVPKEENRAYFDTRDDAITAGYVACKVCKP